MTGINDAEALRSSRRLRAALELGAIVILVASAFGIYRATIDEQLVPGPGFMRATGTPQPLPDLRLQDAAGKMLGLSNFRGKFVLLNVWATWCTPCRKEMPALDRLQQQLGGPDFEVVALSIDRGGAPTVASFYRELYLRALAVYVDTTSEATSTLRAIGIPTTILVDRQGRELWRKTGPAEWDRADFVELFRSYLRGATSS